MMPAFRPLANRFWEKVQKTDGCWEWTAMTNPKGYGCLSVKNVPKLAHRLSWELAFGHIPDGLCVCHHCDNPKCVRPDHLFLGTKASNNFDMRKKGRASGGSFPGSKTHLAKLTEAQVISMRTTFRKDQGKEAARAYGIAYQTAWCILTRRTWRHI